MTLTVHDIKHHLNLSHDDISDDELIAYKIAAALDFVGAYIGEPAAGYATGSISFGPGLMSHGETITIGGEVYRAVEGVADDDREFSIGERITQTVEAFIAAVDDRPVNGPPRPEWFPTLTANGLIISLISTDTDEAANGFTLATTSPDVILSGATLTGGITPAPAIAEAVRRLAAHMYENREAVIVGASVNELPLGIWDLLTPFRKWGF